MGRAQLAAAPGGVGGPLAWATSPTSPSALGTSLGPADITRLLGGRHRKLDNRRVRAIVLSLRGCLPLLPDRLRAVLQLRTGVEVPEALSAGSLAARLHVSRGRLASLEILALRRLSRAARTSGCASPRPAPPGPLPAGYLGAPLYVVGSGGVAAALYLKAPPGSSREPAPAGVGPTEPLGVTPRRGGSSPLFLALIAALAGALFVVYLVRDDMGMRALPARWRRRRSSGPKRSGRRGGSRKP